MGVARSGQGRIPPAESSSDTDATRTRGLAPARDRLAVVRLRFALPPRTPLGPFSRAHPDLQAKITAEQDLPKGRHLAEAVVTAFVPEDFTEDIARQPGVVSVSRLDAAGPSTRYRVTIQQPRFLTLANEFETLLRYPRFIQNGEYTVEAAAPVTQIRRLIQELRRISKAVEVLRFGRDRMRTYPPTLTARQNSLLHQALAAGYFDVPRRISLTRFAKRLGRSKSGLSEALALVEQKLAEASRGTTE